MDITKYIRSQDSRSTVDYIPEYNDPTLVDMKKAAWLAILGKPSRITSLLYGTQTSWSSTFMLERVIYRDHRRHRSFNK